MFPHCKAELVACEAAPGIHITPKNALQQGHWGWVKAQTMALCSRNDCKCKHCQLRDFHSLNLSQLPSIYSLIPTFVSVPLLLVQKDLSTLLWSDSEIVPEAVFQLQAQYFHTWMLLQLFLSAAFSPQRAWRSLVLTYRLQLSWLQSTGQVLASEWLWAFVICFSQ